MTDAKGAAGAGESPARGAKREKIQAPRGTHDILPPESAKWIEIERRTHDLMRRFGFEEIRTPVFESIELFVRGVGEGSDIVRKEMYDFRDKGDRHLSLRPEGTAPVARAAVERGLLQPGRVVKLYYQGPMFRYDRPAAGRFRQFHQMGVEVLGSPSPLADFEAITVFWEWLRELNAWWQAGSIYSDSFAQSITRATRAPGNYVLAWDGLNDKKQPVPQGESRIFLEVNREHGRHATEPVTIKCGAEAQSAELRATPESEISKVEYGSRPQ